MICTECHENGIRSTVRSAGGGWVTLMGGGEPWWDEDGVRHKHDPNRATTPFACSNGHQWGESSLTPCPAPGCDYGKEPEPVTVPPDVAD